ncbi:mediator of RNA polymerase II transcription subunit 15a isoform X2 [Jatropha curcas]|nr:mediator of RNA polymerase II transcription subunit 15a isoform X2 [Jatropha curcas]
MEPGDWRRELSPNSRSKALKYMDSSMFTNWMFMTSNAVKDGNLILGALKICTLDAIKQNVLRLHPAQALSPTIQELAVNAEELCWTESKNKAEYVSRVEIALLKINGQKLECPMFNPPSNSSCSAEISPDPAFQSRRSQIDELQQPTSSMLNKYPQRALRQQQQPNQAPFIQQNLLPIPEQPLLQLQQQEQLKRQWLDSFNTRQNQLLWQQETAPNLQHQYQQKLSQLQPDKLQQNINISEQDKQINSQRESQFQSMNSQSCMIMPQQNNVTSLLADSNHSSKPAMLRLKNMNSQQNLTKSDFCQANPVKSMLQVPMRSLQTSMCTREQTNIGNLLLQSHGNVTETNANSFCSSSFTPQHMNPKRMLEEQHAPVHKLKQNFQQQQLGRVQMQQQQLLWAPEMPQDQLIEVNDLKVRPGIGYEIPVHQMNKVKSKPGGEKTVKSGFQHLNSVGQHSFFHHHPLNNGVSLSTYSSKLLQSASSQITQHSLETDKQNLFSLPTKIEASFCSARIPCSTQMTSSLEPGLSEKHIIDSSSFSNAGELEYQQTTDSLEPGMVCDVKTPEMSTLTLENSGDTNYTVSNVTSADSNDAERPLQHLIEVMKSMSAKAFSSAVTEIASVVSLDDKMAGSAPVCGSKGSVAEDLTRHCNAFGMTKMKRSLFAMHLESTAISCIKRPRIEVNHVLLEEINKVNKCLIDTVVDVSDDNTNSTLHGTDGTEGTIVKCSFSAVAVTPKPCAQISLIQAIQLLVPVNYPNCSPILLETLPVEFSKEHDDISVKAKSKLNVFLRQLSEPMSVGEIARIWDTCARAVISEYAQQNGGGSFSTKYGTWEQCLS